MGLFGFGKKKNDLADIGLGSDQQSIDQQNQPYGNDLNSGLNLDALNNSQNSGVDSFGNPRANMNYDSSFEQSIQRSGGMPSSGIDISKDMQIVIAKLDAIKAEISNISHRLDMLEAKNNQQQAQQKRYW